MTASVEILPAERVGLVKSMARGLVSRCPHCGEGRIFGRFLKVRPDCEACGLALHHHRADDLPPYVVIFVVGHIVGYAILEIETNYDVPLSFQLSFWPIFTLALSLGLLQPVKGAVVGLQYALGMGGFGTLPTARSLPLARPEDVQRGSNDSRASGGGADRAGGRGPA